MLEKQHEEMKDQIEERIQDLVVESAATRRMKKEKPQLKESIYSLRLDELQAWIEENGEKKFRAAQVFEWLYVKRVQNYDDMTNIPKSLRDKLADNFLFPSFDRLYVLIIPLPHQQGFH